MLGLRPICGSASPAPANAPRTLRARVVELTPFAFVGLEIMPIVLKRHDTTPDLVGRIESPPGTPIDITGCTVRFLMRLVGTSTLKIDQPATISNLVLGTVSYAWQPADTDTAGDYEGEFEVTFASGLVRTFPGPGYIVIRIVEDLG